MVKKKVRRLIKDFLGTGEKDFTQLYLHVNEHLRYGMCYHGLGGVLGTMPDVEKTGKMVSVKKGNTSHRVAVYRLRGEHT